MILEPYDQGKDGALAAVDFDLSKAARKLAFHDDGSCGTPAASPIKCSRRRQNLMNGSRSRSSDSGSSSIFDFLTPSTVSTSGSSSCCSSSNCSYESSPPQSERKSSSSPPIKAIRINIDTIHEEEAVEVTLRKSPDVTTPSSATTDSTRHQNESADGTIAFDSSIVLDTTPMKENIHLVAASPETPAAVPYCGWLCAAADAEKHICASLGVDHLVCWQSTIPSTVSTPENRRHRPSHPLHKVRRNLEFQQPIQQSTSFHVNPNSSGEMKTPTKPSCFPSVCSRKQTTPLKVSISEEDDGYGSDPEVYMKTTRPLRPASTTTCVRATSVDELFNERISCLRHSSSKTDKVVLFLERGHLQYANSAPRLCCALNGNELETMKLLEISKILCPTAPTFLLAAARCRCLTIRSCHGYDWTLELSSPEAAQRVACLLKLAVASLAAAVLTEHSVDRLFFDG